MTAPQLLDAPTTGDTGDDDVVHIVCCRDECKAFCRTPISVDDTEAADEVEADCPLCNLVYDDVEDHCCPFGGCCPDDQGGV